MSREKDRIVQVGIIKKYPDGTVNEWQSLVNPEMHIPLEVVEVHGIDDEKVRDAPTFKDLASILWNGLNGEDICGYNVRFDIDFIRSEFKRLNANFKHGRVIDAFKIFTHYHPRNLTAAVKHYLNEDFEEKAHDALEDIRQTARVFEAQLTRHPELPRDVDELSDKFYDLVPEGFLDPDRKLMWRDGEPVFAFGKCEYQSIHKASTRYLHWVLQADFPDTVKDIIKYVLKGGLIDRETHEQKVKAGESYIKE